jgi:hypothetical protein
METLNFEVPRDYRSYFLTFSSKEEYLQKRSEWRTLYKWLSKAIRHNRNVDKAKNRAFNLIELRMIRGGKIPAHRTAAHFVWSPDCGKDVREEFHRRLKRSEEGIPKRVSNLHLDPCELLKIRKEMKSESSRQRSLSEFS